MHVQRWRKGEDYYDVRSHSVIGNKQKPVRITQSTIERRALGYKSERVLVEHLTVRTDQAPRRSSWRIRKLINRLHARKLYAKCTFARRLSYYSNRMSDAMLRERVKDQLTRPHLDSFAKRVADRELTETVRNLRASYQEKALPHPNSRPSMGPVQGIDAMDVV